ncbi:MAG: hypothetical protein JST04_09905 [Bdellovibrionales bacterium]|nr:hypothetical protein [Bdellovibrionales bacterium]
MQPRRLGQLLAIALLSSTAILADLHLVAQGGNSSFDAAPLYDCIAYQGCATTTYTLGGDGRLHIYTAKSIATVLQDFERCDFSSANVSALSYLADGVPTATPLDPKILGLSHPRKSSGSVWPGSSARSQSSPPATPPSKANLSPAVLSAAQLDRVVSLERDLPSHLSKASIDQVVRALGLQTFGYEFLVGKLGGDAGAVTEHDKLTITVDQDLRSDDLPRVIRHELDHVLQMQISVGCRSGSAFDTHEVRERAAYLNDGHFASDNEDFATTNILRYPTR